ncbi:MAG TPA: RagB/SusD family nutrient uptake outer membrane protein, partial [Anseongella sp.]|nr:RagB/SusD family nutrient uptake outer membrane protein [Anseongella sp.]
YTLFQEYSDLRNPARENSGELIFQVQFDEENRNSGLTPVTLPLGFDISSAYADEYGGLVPRPEFVNSFPDGDKRAEERQFFFSHYTPNRANASEVNLGAPYIYKYYHQQAVDVDANSPVNFTVYRLADVMLMYAEASNRAQGGPDALALQCVNDIRARAELPAVGPLPMDAFEKEVWSQRNFELCYEGKMWFDMVRTRMVKNDLTGNWDNFVGHTTVFDATFQEKHLLFPIPKREMDNNAALTQNPGF